MHRCPMCGNENEEDAKVCSQCGRNLKEQEADVEKVERFAGRRLDRDSGSVHESAPDSEKERGIDCTAYSDLSVYVDGYL